MSEHLSLPARLETHAAHALDEFKVNSREQGFIPLELLTRPSVTTREAAHYLNRREQTLRCWASGESGPLLPRRIHGRLYWNVAEIKALLGVK